METNIEFDWRYRIVCGPKWVDFWFKVAPTIFHITCEYALTNEAWVFDETGKMTQIILKEI